LEDRTALSATTTTLSASANSTLVGQSVTLTAVVTGGDFTPGVGVPPGRVTFMDGQTPLATVPVSADVPDHQGVATLTIPFPAAGTHDLTAVYGGESLVQGFPFRVDDPSTSSTLSERVIAPAADVSAQVLVTFGKLRPVFAGKGPNRHTVPHHFQMSVTVMNIGPTAIQGPLELVLDNVSPGVILLSPPAAGATALHPPMGDPFVRFDTPQLAPGASASLVLVVRATRPSAIRVATRVFDGEGLA
jgi:hypothetical protein